MQLIAPTYGRLASPRQPIPSRRVETPKSGSMRSKGSAVAAKRTDALNLSVRKEDGNGLEG
jgi:hypothetical protein